MPGEMLGIGENIKVTVVKAAPEVGILPFIMLFSFIFFMFLCYKAWKTRSSAQAHGYVRKFNLEE